MAGFCIAGAERTPPEEETIAQSTFFQSTPVAPGVTQITGPGQVYCYLVEGQTGALLIDTVCGVGNLAAYCRGLTKLPIQVALTHGHMDHGGGVYDFDEVWVHPADQALLHWMATPQNRTDYVSDEQNRRGLPLHWEPADVTPPRPLPCHALADGVVFDLGGRVVEVLETPGHSAGSVCFLDRANRLFFAGDFCNRRTIVAALNATTIEVFLGSLRKVKAVQGEFDTYLHCHGDNPLDKRCIDEGIECCQRILAGTDDAVPVSLFGVNALLSNRVDERGWRLDGGITNVMYLRSNVFLKEKPEVDDVSAFDFHPYG